MGSAGLYIPDIAHKCKIIFRFLCITETPPLNHETEQFI